MANAYICDKCKSFSQKDHSSQELELETLDIAGNRVSLRVMLRFDCKTYSTRDYISVNLCEECMKEGIKALVRAYKVTLEG
jgi:hypothetical protein